MAGKARLRFAPSPTGQIHIGNIRTALFNWLYARHIDGQFVLRVEDTDVARSVEEYEQIIFKELSWLGLDWDEGPDKDGGYGPYRQSERKEIYQEYADKLMEIGYAYYCYCAEAELEEMREAQKARGEMPRYNGKCAELTDEQRRELEGQGRQPVVRFKVPQNNKIKVSDLIKGDVEFESDGIGDYILIKSNGMASYNFACVVDDYLMDITHVLRGEDHLSNTPRQVMIYDALGFDKPKFGHMSLILGPDKSKLSKRHGDTFIGEYRAKGYLPEAMVNFLALLGWSPPGEQELFSRDEIIELFDISRVAKSAAVFDVDKLKWMNSHYIKEADGNRLLDLITPYLVESEFISEEEIEQNRQWLINAVDLVKEKAATLSEIPEQLDIFYGEKIELSQEAREFVEQNHIPELLEELENNLNKLDEFEADSIKQAIKQAGKVVGVKGKQLFMPVRIAVSGQMQGPELDQLIALTGKELTINRIEKVRNEVANN